MVLWYYDFIKEGTFINFQLNFTISPQKEKALFAFPANECDCSILKGYGTDKNYTVDISEEPSLCPYAIVPRSFADIVRVEPACDEESGIDFSIYPFDENGRNFPLIQYERFDGFNRIYAGTSTMFGQCKEEIKVILGKVKH